MDREFIKKEHLDEDVKRFQEIAEYHSPKQSLKNLYEYTFITEPQINEDGEDDNNVQMVQNASSIPLKQQYDINLQQGQEVSPDKTQMPQNANVKMQPQPTDTNQETDMQEVVPMNIEEPQTDDNIEDKEMEKDNGEEDEVVDVDDLTKSQEATEYKIDGVDDRLAKIYAVVQKFGKQLDKTQDEIMSLKDEYEKRNPTEQEKLNIRSQSSYPYSESPKDYWENKVKDDPKYEIMFNNDVSPSEEQKQFKIKKNDISGLNMKDISDSLNLKQDLNKYLGF